MSSFQLVYYVLSSLNVCKHEGSGKQFDIGGQVGERIFEGAEE